ncbi:MAG TPA: hypothetical protein VN132_05680, partial [Bdellovibrio sp.]|nr:hypothetical protein [Bdellovibrio sp.]
FHHFRFTLLISILTLAGCATSKSIVGPDGTENQLITCGSLEHCYSKAREVCHGPYKIVNTNSEVSGSNGQTSTQIDLLVKCGK